MEKKHAKHRAIPKAIIAHPVYQGMKAKSKMPHRYDMWEDSVIGGLHIFEWIVLLVSALLLVGVGYLGISTYALKWTGGGWILR